MHSLAITTALSALAFAGAGFWLAIGGTLPL